MTVHPWFIALDLLICVVGTASALVLFRIKRGGWAVLVLLVTLALTTFVPVRSEITTVSSGQHEESR
ncbi:MAG: hypothetical protein ACHQ50_07055 [Fimbriimonadales bacterium]